MNPNVRVGKKARVKGSPLFYIEDQQGGSWSDQSETVRRQ